MEFRSFLSKKSEPPSQNLCCSSVMPKNGQCFEVNGQVFACGEIMSPTSAGIEKGKILGAAPILPDISLMQSVSEECMSPHAYNPPANPDWDMAVVDEQKKTNVGQKHQETKIKEDKERKTKGSMWKWMFNSGTSHSAKSSGKGQSFDTKCPTCQSLFVHKGSEDKEQLPPFCEECKSYYVKEGEEDSYALESLVTTLTADDDDNNAGRNRMTKGKIVVIPISKSESYVTALCGMLATKKIESKSTKSSSMTRSNDSSVFNASVSSSQGSTWGTLTTISQEDMSQTTNTPLSSHIVQIESQDNPTDSVFDDDEESLLQQNSEYDAEIEYATTNDEELIILGDPHQVQEIASKAILKKTSQNCTLCAIQCKKCGMPLLDNYGVVACVTCPRISKKAKKIAEVKRFEQKENLTKIHYISSQSVSSDSKATSLGRDEETGKDIEIQLTEVDVSQMNGIFLVEDDSISYSDYEQETTDTTAHVLYEDEIVHQSTITFSAGTSESLHGPLDSIVDADCADFDNEALDAEVEIGEVTNMNYISSHSVSSDATSASLNRDEDIGKGKEIPKDMDVSQMKCIFRVDDNPISYSDYEKEMTDTTLFYYHDDVVNSAESSEALMEVNCVDKDSQALETHIDERIETVAVNCKSEQPDHLFCDIKDEEIQYRDEINIEPVIVTGQNEAKKSRQDQAKERFENQMMAYLAISSSYERSVALSYNSSEEDNLSVDHTLDERPTTSHDSGEFIETQTEEKKIVAMPYHAENEETLDNDTYSDEHDGLDASKSHQMQDVTYLVEEFDVRRKSSRDATDIDSDLHAYQIDNEMPNKELCQLAGDLKISRGTRDDDSMPPASPLLSFSPTLESNHRPSFHISTVPFQSEDLVPTNSQAKNSMEQESRDVYSYSIDEIFDSQPIVSTSYSMPGVDKFQPSSHVSTDPFQNENLIPTAFEAKNPMERYEHDFWGSGVNEIYDPQPIVSMSYSIPGVDKHGNNETTPVTYKEVDPFKDTTNEMSSMKKTFRKSPRRRRPFPESIDGSSVRPRKKEVHKIPKSENPLPKKEAPMASQKNGRYHTKEDQEHLIGLFRQLNTVATRISELEVIKSIKQAETSETNTVTVDYSSSVATNGPVKDYDLTGKYFARMIEEAKISIGKQEDGDVIDCGMDNLFERLNTVSLEMKELDKSIERLKTK